MVVVIGILAAISVVAYNGITNSANDAAVKSDLANISKKIELYRVEKGELPAANMDALGSLKLSASRSSYSEGFMNPIGYNLAYCRGSNDQDFALIAWSKSNKGFAYMNDLVQSFPYTPAPAVATSCPRAGVTGGAALWFYYGGNWLI